MKKTLLIVLPLVIALIAWFWQPITSAILQYSLKNYLLYTTNTDFHVERIRKEDNLWILENLTVTKNNLQFTTEKASLEWQQDPHLKIETGRIFSQGQPLAFFQFQGTWYHTPIGKATLWLEETSKKFEAEFTPNNLLISLLNLEGKDLTKIAHHFFPESKPWEISNGVINGTLLFDNTLQNPTGSITISDLLMKNPSLSFEAKAPKIHLQLAETKWIELSQPASCTLQSNGKTIWAVEELLGSLKWRNGLDLKASLQGLCNHGEQKFPLLLTGHTEGSSLIFEGEYAGLKGITKINPNDADTFMSLHLHGEGASLISLLPQSLKQRLQIRMSDDLLTVEAVVSQILGGPQIQGLLTFSNSKSDNIDNITFRAYLDEDKGYQLKRGWFQADNLSLNKYVAPLIFDNDVLQLNGSADVEGVFDDTSIVLNYFTRNLELSTPYFEMRCERLAETSETVSAIHYFDFITGCHGGQIPLKGAEYLEKSSGLHFQDISAFVTLGQQSVYVKNIEAFCGNVYFSGAVDIDYSHIKEGCVDVVICMDNISGNITDVKNLLTHILPENSLFQTPLEGNVALKQDGSFLHFRIQPQAIQTQAVLQGRVTEGVMKLPGTHISLHDLSTNFAFDFRDETLAFTDIQGNMFVESQDNIEEYNVSGDHIKLTNFREWNSDFDMWVGDKNRDILRLVGKTNRLHATPGFEVILDNELSHFGIVHPNSLHLVFTDTLQLETLDVQFGFSFESLFKDLQRFSRTGLFPFPESWIKQFNDLKNVAGDFLVKVNYDNQKALLTYRIASENFSIDKYTLDCLLEGKKKGSTWTIDQLKLDSFSFAADITHQVDLWNFNFLGIRCGNSILAGLEAELRPNENCFDAKINLLEINLENLKEWPFLADFVEKSKMGGECHAKGRLLLDWGKEKHKFSCEALLNATLKRGRIHDIEFDQTQQFSVQVTSDKNIVINNLRTAIKEESRVRAALDIEKIEFDLATRNLKIDNLKFDIPKQHLPWAAKTSQKYYPEIVSPNVANLIENAIPTGNLHGTLSLHSSPKNKSLKVSLPAGEYNLSNMTAQIEKAVFECDSLEFRGKALCKVSETPLWFSVRSELPTLNSGQLSMSTQEPAANETLMAQWTNDPQTGFAIQSVSGTCAGLSVNLWPTSETPTKTFSLKGDVTFDTTAKILCPAQMRSTIEQAKLGGTYTLSGKWQIAIDEPVTSPNKFAFSGTLKGQNCLLGGYQCDSLSANIEGSPDQITVKELALTDPSGTIEASYASFTKNQMMLWTFSIPKLSVNDFRVGLLRTSDGLYLAPENTFIIRQMQMENLSGMLFDPATYKAEGEALCQNPPRRDQPNTIWNIPTETLSKVGLDLSVLSPVAGFVQYQVADQKIYLTKFKEMYSAGKLSKFSLPKKATKPSYIDFDGNIHVQVRMKQSSLLYKLAELFTVTIEGTLLNPTYSIIEQDDDES